MQPEWQLLNTRIKGCGRCAGLNKQSLGTQNAPGYGNRQSPLALIGQSLCGKPCIESQIPFTGGSGLLLDDAILLAGFTKADVYTTNVVKCHPPNNRPSLPHEVENCRDYLDQEIEWVNPKIIVCLGKDAWRSFNAEVAKPTNQIIENREVHFLYHPSYIRRQKSSERNEYVRHLSELVLRAFS
jgi:uracil-DNA glycosylase